MRKMKNTLILGSALTLPLLSSPLAAQNIQADRSLLDSGDGEEQGQSQRLDFSPYIEAAQVVSAELQPGSDVVTYSRVAAGADASFGTR